MASDDNDIDRLWSAIRDLQGKVGGGSGSGGFTPPGGSGGSGGGSGGSGGSGGGTPITPAEWVAGAITRNLPPGGPRQMMQQAAQEAGVAAEGFTGSSSCWCTSRFVCASMSCGGSGWC